MSEIGIGGLPEPALPLSIPLPNANPLGRPDVPGAGFEGDLSRDPEEVGKQFETLFLTYLVRELKLGRTPGLDGEDGGGGIPGAQIYEGFITQALAESLAKSGAFGIGEAVAEYVRNHAAAAGEAEKREP